MQTILILKGLPGSGKSTFAKKLLDKENGKWKRVNKDDLRGMIDNGKWGKKNEEFILRCRDSLIMDALSCGYNVIVDDTNLSKKHEEQITNIARSHMDLLGGSTEVIVKFFDTPVEECIKNDLNRDKSVGKDVIMDMYNKFLSKRSIPERPPLAAGVPWAVICDIDGTLAHMNDGRDPYEWDKVGQDTVDEFMASVLELHRANSPGLRIILVSGRDSVCRFETEEWLAKNHVPYDSLFMRPEGDIRKDSIIKKEIYDKFIKGNYNVVVVFDDRNQTVEMWRSLGLRCYQVADGNF